MNILYRVFLSSLFVIAIVFFCLNPSVLAVSEKNTSDIFNTGLDNVHQNNYQQALVNFTQVIDRQGEYKQAIAQYERVIQRDNRDYRAYYNRSIAYLALNNYHKAIVNNTI